MSSFSVTPSTSGGINLENLVDELFLCKVNDYEPARQNRLGPPKPAVNVTLHAVSPNGKPSEPATGWVFATVLVDIWGTRVGEWVAGRLIRPGRAYLIDDLDDAEHDACEKAFAMLSEEPF
jgi:hypothetical protein